MKCIPKKPEIFIEPLTYSNTAQTTGDVNITLKNSKKCVIEAIETTNNKEKN